MPDWMSKRNIKVEVRPDGHGGYDITPKEGNLNLKDNELVCNKHEDAEDLYKGGFHLLLFKIKNHDGAQLRFEPVARDAFWAAEVPPSAKSGPTTPSQIADCIPAAVDRDGGLLVVINLNPEERRIGYTLRLLDHLNASHVCDPIMGNANGGRSFVEKQADGLSPLTLTTGLVAAAALVGGLGYALAGQQAFGRKHK